MRQDYENCHYAGLVRGLLFDCAPNKWEGVGLKGIRSPSSLPCQTQSSTSAARLSSNLSAGPLVTRHCSKSDSIAKTRDSMVTRNERHGRQGAQAPDGLTMQGLESGF